MARLFLLQIHRCPFFIYRSRIMLQVESVSWDGTWGKWRILTRRAKEPGLWTDQAFGSRHERSTILKYILRFLNSLKVILGHLGVVWGQLELLGASWGRLGSLGVIWGQLKVIWGQKAHRRWVIVGQSEFSNFQEWVILNDPSATVYSRSNQFHRMRQ